MSEKQTRRDFLKAGAKTLAAFGAAAGSLPIPGWGKGASGAASATVVTAQRDGAINNRNRCDIKEVTSMFNQSLAALTGKKDAAAAWASLGLNAQDTVAIKVNCCTWTIQLSPHQELLQALCESMKSVIPLNRMIVYDRATSALENGGLKSNTSATGVKCFGNNNGDGYHAQQNLTRIITDTATKVINLASLKCVEGAFVASLFMKNHIGSLRDGDMSKCHGNPFFLAEVNARPAIKDKTILNLCDGLRGTYKRGVPWYWGGIIMGKDPVASEYTALRLLNKKRRQEGLSTLDIPRHLEIAENKYKLGTCNPRKVKILTV
ncbi:MAG: DUF362 domain-containing protein [bacterium]|nr:DUF362 domain-containing protein [bacterium]